MRSGNESPSIFMRNPCEICIVGFLHAFRIKIDGELRSSIIHKHNMSSKQSSPAEKLDLPNPNATAPMSQKNDLIDILARQCPGSYLKYKAIAFAASQQKRGTALARALRNQ